MKQKFADHHIHTSYSRCAPGNYDLTKIVEKLSDRHYPYYCVSDHIHFDYDDKYFSKHIEIKDKYTQNNFEIPIFLGAEFTILDELASIPKQSLNQSNNQLDYSIIADHFIPNTNITMNDLITSRKLLLDLLLKKPKKLDKIFTQIKNSYINSIQKNQPTILGHPFSTFLRCGFPHKKLIDIFNEICDICKENSTAVEINNSDAKRCMNINIIENKNYKELIDMNDFYIQIIKIMKKSNILISFGSDAHRPHTIGDISISIDLFEKYELNPSKVIQLI